MSVQFILGRSGTGKTRHLLSEMADQIKADPLGPAIYWLLPKQATFEAERLLTARLGAFTRVRVVSFDQLGKEILIHCGDVDIPEVTTLGRRMVIGHLLRLHQTQLKYYSSAAHRPGLAAELDSTFGEFDRAGLDLPALDLLVKNLALDHHSAPDLADKFSDLQLLLDAYNKYIGQEKLDPARRLALILNRASDCAPLKQTQIFVDDFYDFTAHERRMLAALAEVVNRTVIALLVDPDSAAVAHPEGRMPDLSVFHRTERTYLSLRESFKGVALQAPVLLRKPYRYTAPDLSAIEAGLFSGQTSNAQVTCIECFDAPDARSEVDAVARRIKRAIAGGWRYRDIGVLVRDLSVYQQIVDASFGEHDLPYFADHRRTAAHHPLLQMVRAMLLIARHGWPHEAVMSLVKSGLAGLDGDDADELENYVLQHRIRGRKWEAPEPWEYKRDLTLAEDEGHSGHLSDAERVDANRRLLVSRLAPLLEVSRSGKPQLIRDIAAGLFLSLEAFGVRDVLLRWMSEAEQAGALERRAEHQQVWTELVELFDHMVDLLGGESISLADFIAVLDSGLESFDLALTPPKVDQILVGQIDRTRAPELKMVFVLGLNEGEFPRLERERCVITDRERRNLRSRNIDLDHDSERRLLDERFLAYVAFTRASQQIIFSRPTANAKGKLTNPSLFWLELLALLPQMPVQHLIRELNPSPGNIGTHRQLVTGLLRWARSPFQTHDSESLWPALYQWLALVPAHTLRDQAWRSLVYDNHAALDPALAKLLFPSPLSVAVTQLETMAECPFRHFSRYGLTLRGREAAEVTGIDLSNAYHEILENLVQEVLQEKLDWCSLTPANARQMIRTHAAEIGRKLRNEVMLSTSRNRYLLQRIEQTLERSVAAMCEVNRRGKYRPTFAGITFGEGQTLPPYVVVTPAGEQVQVQGKIDRVDLNDKRSGFVVLEYKLATGPLALGRVYHGLSLKLLTYLLVIQANGEQLTGKSITPAAGFLLQLLRSPQPVDHPQEAMLADDPDFHLQVKPRGLVESRAVKSLDADLVEGHSKVVGVYLRKDGSPGNRHATDIADKDEFEALLLHVEQRLGELADQIFSGDVTVRPYMIAGQTPCSRCEYRSVCRFEPGVNHYRMLPGMKREDVLNAVSGGVQE